MLLKANKTLHDFPFHPYWFGRKPSMKNVIDSNFTFSCLEEFYLFRFANITTFNIFNLNHTSDNVASVWFDRLDNLIKCFQIKCSSSKSKIRSYEKYLHGKYPVNDTFDYRNPRSFY
ncbi:conserved Plasmodium protein, unknown function [Plasmodium vivax]|uniref:Uncharacterized protein n=7 Tax=Plasmodium vivax TaxID=5855 RepID=A5K9Q4_PLAVS|nr:hypothetical protein, conserved [Plasmodium vivax]KMZ82889.1 hypothetical protein PVIIG_04640 [Plasmodium vivax India VII]KMZ89189.1 hypothetical protein PVBG_03539 [Plasmodium vivax Brazil I]KMZ95511.1 hypothetical protein PVMG_04304 [Plasmodium vivax Mauritania I]KNA02095.1 hypothetical protein PVNG_05618 [Plasmodium vivax North Korean]EDL43792.1 hypothetical protein, conserved [Plasmodium vivax]|eukprot:XP_001613519.1 hypothetical protein [Plasmodium vivax Sal-1]